MMMTQHEIDDLNEQYKEFVEAWSTLRATLRCHLPAIEVRRLESCAMVQIDMVESCAMVQIDMAINREHGRRARARSGRRG